MVATKSSYCHNCNGEVEAQVIPRSATYTFKGETFNIEERVLVCSCGEEIPDETLDSEVMKTLKKMYEERVGLSLNDIKEIRKHYGLSMEKFAKVLGWSKATIARYETGKYIPDSSHMSILKKLKERPEIIDDYYKLNKHKFSEKDQEKIEKQLEFSDHHTVERNLTEALMVNYKLYEKTEDSGYAPFSLDKLINMILFFTQSGIQKTLLMKTLFYSDFLSFKRNLVSITGTPYVKLPYGPVPKDYDLLLSTLEKNGVIDTNYDYDGEFTTITLAAKEEFEPTFFEEDELEVMEKIKEFFQDKTSRFASEFSHEEAGWKYTDERDIISYEYAETLQLD